jgi:hypothetical protein
MDRSSPHQGSVDGGFLSAEEWQDFQMTAPDTARAAPARSSLSLSSLAPRTPVDAERTNAAIVIVLTLACTAMAFFDLFVLALGS